MRLSIIVAMAENRVIGFKGGIPWHISDDLKYFKKITMGAPVLMGRKTFQSIGQPLPGRSNFVITRNDYFSANGIEIFNDIGSALEKIESFALKNGIEESYIIGGAEIFNSTFEKVDRLYLTEVHIKPHGDTRFLSFSKNDWLEVKRKRFESKLKNEPAYSITVYDRKR